LAEPAIFFTTDEEGRIAGVETLAEDNNPYRESNRDKTDTMWIERGKTDGENARNAMRFIYEDWQADEVTSGTAFKKYVRKLKEMLIGKKNTGTGTTAYTFCENEGEEDAEAWNEWRLRSTGFDAPFCVDFGGTRLELHFNDTSKAKFSLIDRASEEGKVRAFHKVELPNVTGQIIKSIIATTTVPVDTFRKILDAWRNIFEFPAFDEMFEKMCGVDYARHTVENEALLWEFVGYTPRVLQQPDIERHLYDNFLAWFENLSEQCTHIKILGF
jgi:hypothetical protein